MMILSHLQNQAAQRSGNGANKDRKNLVAAWNWGAKYIDHFPPGNPCFVDRFPEIRTGAMFHLKRISGLFTSRRKTNRIGSCCFLTCTWAPGGMKSLPFVGRILTLLVSKSDCRPESTVMDRLNMIGFR